MADSQLELRWTGEGLRFESKHASGNDFQTDGDDVTAHSPVQVLLLSLASCMAADVVDILTKMRLPLLQLITRVKAHRNAEPPRYLTRVHMHFETRGIEIDDESKVLRAIELSHEKYCSVFHSLRNDLDFSTALTIG